MNEAAVSKNKSDDREISRILQQLEGEGAFASCRKAPSGELHVSIRGFGNLRWPVRDAAARKLCRMAQLAHHGYKAETRLDKGVRDTWEISGDRLNIGPASWSSTLNRHLERLRRDLGLPGTCKLKAELHNLLIYTPGQFFSAHQDSQKHSRMVGTLAVVLPSSFGGGELIIEHRGKSLRTGGSARELTLVGFYADCRHEVRPVKSGHRLVLTYHLMVEGDTSHGDLTARRLDELTEAVRTHFSGQRPPRWTGGAPREAPDKLVYLLDHEYTPRDLSWRRLKNGDSRRAAALREAARRLDCEIFLTLADVHETWACEEDDGGRYIRDRLTCVIR